MLSENQVKRLLKQSESAYKIKKQSNFEGWIQALRLVLEKDTYPIKKIPLKEKDE